MLPNYDDIRSRIKEEPSWFDGNGVPRYGEFHPKSLGVYDHFAVLIKIECQSCRRPFTVGEGYPTVSFSFKGDPIQWTWDDIIGGYHYGDPPSHGGCVGNTMNCVDRIVLGAWQLDDNYEWQPVADVVGRDLTPDWSNA